jgi:maltose O-acetyltransferase
MKKILNLIYFFNMKYIGVVKKFYYQTILKSCGKNLRVYGHVNIKSPFNISIGNNCTLNDNVYLNGWSTIDIGDNVSLSASCKLISTSLDIESFSKKTHQHIGKGINIGNNVQIGAGAIVLDGVTIGDNVVVGAGSVVTKSIDSNKIIAGTPAKILRSLESE